MEARHLCAEIESLLNAPYPASLQTFHTALQRSSTAAITGWATIKPCQVSPLLGLLVSRTPPDTLASHVLLYLSDSKAVFDALVRQEPSVLESLCGAQLDCLNHHASTAAGKSRLLHALPSSIAAPVSYYNMLDVLIQDDGGRSCRPWQHRVYQFLAGVSLEMLSSLSEETVRISANRWQDSMRSKDNVDSLYAAYVASRLQRHQPGIAGAGSSMGSCLSISPLLRAWIDKCAAYFNGEQVVRSVQLSLLGILKLVWDGSGRTLANAATAIFNAEHVVTTAMLSSDFRWNDTMGDLLRKIAEKLNTISPDLQLACLAVLKFSKSRASLPYLLTSLRTTLSHVMGGQHFDIPPIPIILHVAGRCTELDLPQEGAASLTAFFRDLWRLILEQCQPQNQMTMRKSCAMQQALSLVKSLQDKTYSVLSNQFLLVIKETGLPEWWPLDMSTPGSPENCSGLITCVHLDETRRQQLRDALSIFIMTQASRDGIQLPTKMVEMLNRRWPQSMSQEAQTLCMYHPFIFHNRSLPTQAVDAVDSNNWRRRLQDSLANSNANTGQLVEHIIVEVTKHLQDRCDHVERPIRVAQAEVNCLRENIAGLEQRLLTTVSEKQELQNAMEIEQKESAENAATVQLLRSSTEALQQQLTEARERVVQQNADLSAATADYESRLEEATRGAATDIDRIKIEYATAISKLETSLSSQTQAKSALDGEVKWLKDTMQLAKAEMEAEHDRKIQELQHRFGDEEALLQDKIKSLESDAASRDNELDRLKRGLDSKDVDVAEVEQKCKRHEEDLASTRSKLASESADRADLERNLTDFRNANEELASELKKREKELETEINRAAELEDSVSHWRQQFNTTETALTEARKREEGIQALLGGGGNGFGGFGRGSPRKTGQQNQRATTAALPRRSTQYGPASVAPSRQLSGMISSEDDTDYFQDDIVELGR